MSAWTENEQRALIAAYNAMLAADAAGIKINKAAINRWLRADATDSITALDKCGLIDLQADNFGALAARNRASIELKLMNISGARAALGLPILKGYKPASNFQKSLTALVQEAQQ